MEVKILIVDDSASDRAIIASMLADYHLLTACDGVEAMQILAEHQDISLIILDLNMPNMNGFEVLEQLGASDRFARLRTIILTNYNELYNEIKGLKMGAVDYVRKPIHMESLRARIEVHIELLRIQHSMEQRYQDQLTTLETIFAKAPIGIAVSFGKNPGFGKSNETFSVNQTFEEITGRTKKELLELGWAAITHPDDVEGELEQYNKLLAGEIHNYVLDKRFIRPDGSIVWVHLLATSLLLSDNHRRNHVILARDITDKKIIEGKLRESERSKSVLLSHLPGMAYRCKYDRDWTMQFVSSGCLELTGYPPEALLYNNELSFNEVISPEYRGTLWNKWRQNLAKKTPFRHEYEITTADGTRKWVLEMGQGIFNKLDKIEALEGIIIDISDRKEMEDKLRYINEHDAWTGLYNRRYLESVLTRESEAPFTEKAALISVNLNAMHALSLTYGFHYGLDLAKRISEELGAICADNCLLFNTHEYRFVFYKKGYKALSELFDFCRQIERKLDPLLSIDRINFGLGIIELDETNRHDVEPLLRKLLIASEEALLFSSDENPICVYDQDLERRISRRETLQHALSRIATEKHEDQLFLQYQPILDLQKNCICGFEALARYNNEELGLVSPLEFIPIIEKTKHIIPIGKIIAAKAFEFLHTLQRAGYGNLTVSINVSVVQLLSRHFVEELLQIITDSRVRPEQIMIELTESAFSSNFAEINRILGQLREYGIRSAIDDFGTGYSSLSRERELNVDCLKIDKAFIDKLMLRNPEQTITSDIISIGHKLGHFVVAEGVEHEKQLEYLRASGCDSIQGYLLSRPLDPQKALEFLERFGQQRK